MRGWQLFPQFINHLFIYSDSFISSFFSPSIHYLISSININMQWEIMSNNFEKWFWSRNTLSDRLAPSVTRMQCFFPFIEGLLQRTEEFTRSPDQKFANKTKRRLWRTRNPMFYGEAEWIPSGEQKKKNYILTTTEKFLRITIQQKKINVWRKHRISQGN